MKTFIILSILMLFVSCGRNTVLTTQYVDRDVPTEVFITQDFEGSYYFDNGGYLELIAGSDGEVTIMREGQSIQSINPNNDTLGSHPSIYATGLEAQSNTLRYFANVRYTDGNDIEEDVSGADIRDTRRTDYEIKLLESGRIRLTIKVYSDSIGNNTNYVVAERVLTSN